MASHLQFVRNDLIFAAYRQALATCDLEQTIIYWSTDFSERKPLDAPGANSELHFQFLKCSSYRVIQKHPRSTVIHLIRYKGFGTAPHVTRLHIQITCQYIIAVSEITAFD
jgi:hypothetical protein